MTQQWIIDWLPAIVIAFYLAIVLYIGIFAFRKGRATGEDFFLASRSIGGIVFFLSLFATNMTAFAILGSSGMAYKVGIGVFGMMATSSALVIPLTLFFIGTRLWALGKRFGHMTQVAFFRDRWECSFIGTIIFIVTASMLLPYLIISIDGGGTILMSLTKHGPNGESGIPYWLGGLIVTLIVMATVFFGGMRGAVWVNVMQTLLFISFGVIAFVAIGRYLDTDKNRQSPVDGFREVAKTIETDPSNDPKPVPLKLWAGKPPAAGAKSTTGPGSGKAVATKPASARLATAPTTGMAAPITGAPASKPGSDSPPKPELKPLPPMARMGTLLDRERIPWQVFLSFMLIPLSSIMFPHMSIMCFTAKKVTAFKKTVILYPICIAAIWLPCVFLGALGPSQETVRKQVAANSESLNTWLETGGEPAEAGKHPDGDLVALNAALDDAVIGQELAPKIRDKKISLDELKESAAKIQSEDFTKAFAKVSADSDLLKKWHKSGGAAAVDGKTNEELKELNVALTQLAGPKPLKAKELDSFLTRLHDVKEKKAPLSKMEAVEALDGIGATIPAVKKAWTKVAANNSDSVLLEMLKVALGSSLHLKILFGLLAAGIISAVMGSDCHQILGLSTMFTKDIFTYYGGGKHLGEKSVVHMGRAFIIGINVVAYIIALGRPPIFDLAVTYAFSGFAALAPLMIAALFWKRSTKWGALLCTLWVAAWVIFMVYAEGLHHNKAGDVFCQVGDLYVLFMSAQGKISFMGWSASGVPAAGFSAVVPMALGAALVMVLGSLITPRPSQATIDKYFPRRGANRAGAFSATAVAK